MFELNSFIKRVNDQSVEAFKGQKRILSFQQYLESFCANPVRLGRNAAAQRNPTRIFNTPTRGYFRGSGLQVPARSCSNLRVRKSWCAPGVSRAA